MTNLASRESKIHIDTLLALRKAYSNLRQRYENDENTKKYNGFEVLILILANEATSPKEFAELLSCNPAQITGYVSRLETLGHLKRQISNDDRRSFNFQLTERGKEVSDNFLRLTKGLYDKASGLTYSENLILVRLLKKL